MARTMWRPAALALGAVLAAGGFVGAQEKDVLRLSGTSADRFGGTTMTLAGSGTVADAATEDVELTRHGGWGGGYHGGYHGGYRGGFYGGYRGGYYGGYARYYGGGYGRYYGGYYGGYR